MCCPFAPHTTDFINSGGVRKYLTCPGRKSTHVYITKSDWVIVAGEPAPGLFTESNQLMLFLLSGAKMLSVRKKEKKKKQPNLLPLLL